MQTSAIISNTTDQDSLALSCKPNSSFSESFTDQNLSLMQSELIKMNAVEDVKELIQGLSKEEKLEQALLERTESLHFCSHKLQQQKKEIEKIKAECQQKIVSVREFWRDKIFNESSRAGRIVKRAYNGK